MCVLTDDVDEVDEFDTIDVWIREIERCAPTYNSLIFMSIPFAAHGFGYVKTYISQNTENGISIFY